MPTESAYAWAFPMIPLLPLLAALVIAICPFRRKETASNLAIGSMVVSFLISFLAVINVAKSVDEPHFFNFTWFEMGNESVRLGWVMDPLSTIMVVMITFVSALIFWFSTAYMKEDENYQMFFCYLALFAAAMLGLVISNNLLLLFMCWELVGVASYLLIGFWYQKPSAAAAAKKAFITTRIGDLGFLIGMLWLYSETGTLLFFDETGTGCLEQSAVAKMVGQTTLVGMTVSTAISLLIFCGAIGKSGQLPLHVWLPDAMEGPTPVSALIHAATMVAAGVFLMARIYPLISAAPPGVAIATGLQVMTWVGAITAVFAAFIAIGQFDIKRVLAYSTVSQLGYMFMGLGVGGVSVAMFHLIVHAFFKALLFLGSGSVIYGCHHEQDMRKMGALKGYMWLTFGTYAVGMIALSGVLPIGGFWSKDAILHSAWEWDGSKIPFLLGLLGAFLTAFYMTRQMYYVFFGDVYRGDPKHCPHESPAAMYLPLVILALATLVLGFVGTPLSPAFQAFLDQKEVHGHWTWGVSGLLMVSLIVVGLGVLVGLAIYAVLPHEKAEHQDELEDWFPKQFATLRDKFYIDELYGRTFLKWHRAVGDFSEKLDRRVISLGVTCVSLVALGISWLSRFCDDYLINPGFDEGCKQVRQSGGFLASLQNGRIQEYLRVFGVALFLFLLTLFVASK
jgi:NADH-quinone oxidoreductase subunit L